MWDLDNLSFAERVIVLYSYVGLPIIGGPTSSTVAVLI